MKTRFEDYKERLGLIATSDITDNNESKKAYYDFLKANDYKKVGPGLYADKDEWVDYLCIIVKRCPQAVISHDEALYYYGLIDREPASPTFTIYSGFNVSRLKKDGYRAFFVKKELLELGKTEVTDLMGNKVPMYDLERTICDLIRNRSAFEIQDFNCALKSYARRKDKNISKLMDYAKKLRVSKILMNYMGVLL